MSAARRRVGLLGGSFDPPHEGHLWMARQAFKEAALAELWFMPACKPPHKLSRALSPYEDRLAMTELLAQEESFLSVCRIEESLPLPGYSIRTIQALKEQHPQTDFVFIIGEDSLATLEGWKDPDAIFAEVEVFVLAREGFETDSSRPCQILRSDFHPAQSRLIRDEITESGSSEHLTAPVSQFVKTRGLYREGKPS
jgi:nicotinate-nucleotide adenylyltransferase